MKRIFLFFLTTMFLVGLCACAPKEASVGKLSNLVVNDFSGASMKVKEGSITSKGLTVEIECTKKNDCIYGEEYSLELYQGEQWHSLNYITKDRVAWNAIGYVISSGETREFRADWEKIYGELGKGHYRIIKSINDFRAAGDFDSYTLAAEFSVEKE